MSARILLFRGQKIFLAAVGLLLTIPSAWAQTADCLDERPNHLVRSVEVKARWIPDTLSLPVKRGDAFTPDGVQALRRAFIDALKTERNGLEKHFTVSGKFPLVEFSSVRACGLPVPAATCRAEGLTDQCTDVVVHAYTLSIDSLGLGSDFLLPIPRSNKFSFLSAAPRPLRIFNPALKIVEDPKLGILPKLAISTDLITLPKLLKRESTGANKNQLLLKAEGGRSPDEGFYTSHASLNWVLQQPQKQIESFGFETDFTAKYLPQEQHQFWENAYRAGGHIAFNPAAGLVNRIILNAAYRGSSNRLISSLATENIQTDEHSFEGRVLMEGRINGGFLRTAFWFDRGTAQKTHQSYHRIAMAAGFATDIPAGDNTIGIEVLGGLGRASSDTPEYRHFYSGNYLGSFLYDDGYDPNLIALPAGPLLRSSSYSQGGVQSANPGYHGGNSYQHLNLTVSIPIPGLAYPLIPDETIHKDVTLRSLIKNFALGSGESALSVTLQEEGLSEEEADRKAKTIFDQIRPGVHFLVDYAKLLSLKPLILLDATRISRLGNPDAQTRYAIGGGLQLTVVVAKFEIGYMRAVHRYEGDRHGSLIARLVFQNLF